MPTSSKKGKKLKPKTLGSRARGLVSGFVLGFKNLLSRRPHRSFRLTKRRDYLRPLELPGIFSFTAEVSKTVWKYKRLFLPLVIIYIVLYSVLVGVFSQDSYDALRDTLGDTSDDALGGLWGTVGQASILMVSVLTSGVSGESTELQQMIAVLLAVLCWLTVVWLLRNLMAGHKVNLRDAIYSSGAPIFATILIALFMLIQLLPVALAIVGYVAASSTGLLDSGAPAMLFWVAAALMVVLSLYWLTSSLFALSIVTLPGTYPAKALRIAGDLMVGRRVKILIRWLWMILVTAIVGAIALTLTILLDMGIKSLVPALSWLPLVPFVIVVVSGFALIWGASYIYLLYRKVVDYVPA